MARFKTLVVLSRDEIEKLIPYKGICEARYGASWDTQKRRTAYRRLFTKEEQEHAEVLFHLSRKWYLRAGTPEEREFSDDEFALWKKLGSFCGSGYTLGDFDLEAARPAFLTDSIEALLQQIQKEAERWEKDNEIKRCEKTSQ